jgi:predicted PurR-regulated permease PerM
MEDKEIKKYVVVALFILLAVLSYFIIKPIFLSIFVGLILAYLLSPLYRLINKGISSKTISALIVVLLSAILIAVPTFFLVRYSLLNLDKVYSYISSISNLEVIIQKVFPELLNNAQIAVNIHAITASLSSKITGLVSSAINNMFFNIIPILLNVAVAFFIFFIALRDQEEFREYIISLSPFSKEYQKKFYDKFDSVTYSVIYGELIVGISQGIIAGIGYFICGVPHALLLTVLTTIVGVIPIIGPWLIWIPVDIYLFINGNTNSAIGLLIYGLFIINWVDTILRPIIVSRGTKINSAIALIGMTGGIYVFGIMGLIIGPLILAYLILLIEAYKDKKIGSMVFQDYTPEEIKT